MSFSFPTQEKLKSKKRIDQIFAEGSSVTQFPIKLLYVKTTEPTTPQVQAGVTAAKRNFKKAVSRNRIKRLMRESYRHHKSIVLNNSTASYAFLFIYLGKEMPTSAVIFRSMEKVLHKFNTKQAHQNET